jgi:hypothetical protein
MRKRWESGKVDQKKQECIRHIATWADYAHFQYCAGFCVIFGALTGWVVSEGKHNPSWEMIGLTCLLLVAGFMSDWRLRTVQDEILK